MLDSTKESLIPWLNVMLAAKCNSCQGNISMRVISLNIDVARGEISAATELGPLHGSDDDNGNEDDEDDEDAEGGKIGESGAEVQVQAEGSDAPATESQAGAGKSIAGRIPPKAMASNLLRL